jgi:acyl-CoA thioesterase
MLFEDASAVDRVDDKTWRADVKPGWDIAGNANGGYLLAIAARAAARASGRHDVVTITGHFLSPVQAGQITIEPEVLKEGRRFSTIRSTVRAADGRAVLATLGTFADLGPADGPERIDGAPPELPAVDECVPVEPTDGYPPPFMGQVDLRLHPEDVGFSGSPGDGVPRMRGWFRWRDQTPVDTFGLVVACDAFPPTTFNANLPIGWTPTVELTVHVRECPARDGWLRCAFETRFISAGFIEEDGELWDEAGRLVGQSRQLALLPRQA